MKNKVQAFGKFLSGMVMPNIGAFIAWGFLAALFIEKGWIPNAQLSSMVTPILTYLLPILIASQGGKMVGGERGRVIGAIAVIGCVCGTDSPMLMGAMAIGPLAGWVIKKFDQLMDGHMPTGFEMLINNFSVGILGLILMIIGYYFIGPIMSVILAVLGGGVSFLVSHSLLPLVAVFLEPAKVLFLNNAINQGVFTPLGIQQVEEMGKSIMYMLETNPGPGLGVLLAYSVFCKDKATKSSAPGAVIIHFFGGIHEIYFPYVLMNPAVIVAPIAGNICAILFFNLMGAGLNGPASPGSIIAFMMMTPKTQMLVSALGVIIAAGVSFVIASPIVMASGSKSLEDAQSQVASMKAESKGMAAPAGAVKITGEIRKIVFACDAGMGSSAMGATKFRNRIKAIRPDITVTNTSVDNVPGDADIVVCQTILQDRAAKSAPQAQLVTIGNFLADPALDTLFEQVTASAQAPAAPAEEKPAEPEKKSSKSLLVKEGILLGQKADTKEEAIQAAGELLHKLGYVDESYIPAMQEREKLATTYMGMGIAIPHGTSQAKGTVKKSGIVVLQYPDGVPFGDEKANLVFGIAGVGDEHLEILSNICGALEDEEIMEALLTAKDPAVVLDKLG
ncbi:MAG TPA: PTS mannitol transporter subunit IICBA [Lachnospiraceae bacterium]|nr:PTS mannitol transporter subunit IICBA [Lachnospiraceae bacterium]